MSTANRGLRAGPGKEHTVPTYKLVRAEDGAWLEDVRLNGFDRRAGDRIHRDPGDTLEVVQVLDADGDEKPVLVVRSGGGLEDD
jgi:hypothetical protein